MHGIHKMHLKAQGPTMMDEVIQNANRNRKLFNPKIIQNNLASPKKPSFSGNEYVPHFKRQKTTEKEKFKDDEGLRKVGTTLHTFLKFYQKTLIKAYVYTLVLSLYN